jgi:hypothetical protein
MLLTTIWCPNPRGARLVLGFANLHIPHGPPAPTTDALILPKTYTIYIFICHKMEHYIRNSEDDSQERPSLSPIPNSDARSQSAVKLYWKTHWRLPVQLLGSLLCGIALAVFHHIYYKSLDGNIISQAKAQQWPIRFGTAFSFLAASLLKAAVKIAYTQYMWTMLRHKYISIKGIDKMFSITSNPISLCSFELGKDAKVVLILAIFKWYVFILRILNIIIMHVRTILIADNPPPSLFFFGTRYPLEKLT